MYRVKWAQRAAFIERFYGKSREQQEAELTHLLSYGMNVIDAPSRYRGPTEAADDFEVIENPEELIPEPTAAPQLSDEELLELEAGP